MAWRHGLPTMRPVTGISSWQLHDRWDAVASRSSRRGLLIELALRGAGTAADVGGDQLDFVVRKKSGQWISGF